jgi:HlyD family secretion protein
MPKQKTTPIKFRQEALTHLSEDQPLQNLIQVTSAKSWILLSVIGILILGIILWGIFGTIPTWVEGKGIILVQESNVYDATVPPDASGQITQFLVNSGDHVKRDDLLARLKNTVTEKQVGEGEKYLTTLTTTHQTLLKQSETEITERQKELTTQKDISTRKLKDLQEYLVFLRELVAERKESYEKKIIGIQLLEDSYRDYHNTNQSIEGIQDQLLHNQQELNDFIDKWKQRLRDLSLKIKDEEYQVNKLKQKLYSSTEIRSPVTGIVTSLQKTTGDYATGGDPIATIVAERKKMDGIIYIPPEQGKRVKVRMKALVSPTIVKKEEFGSIKACVVSVSDFPITPQSLKAVLQNDTLVKEFSQNGPPIAVRVNLVTDPSTYSGLAWTSSQGPEQHITPGTLTEGRIVVRKQAPISLIIPAFKKLFGY